MIAVLQPVWFTTAAWQKIVRFSLLSTGKFNDIVRFNFFGPLTIRTMVNVRILVGNKV
jgi:hypothetical protein